MQVPEPRYFCEGRLEAFRSNRALLGSELTEFWCKWKKLSSVANQNQKQT